jgi:hypothetical protein
VSRWPHTPVPVFLQPAPVPQPVALPTPLLENHKHLEDALRKLNNKVPSVPPVKQEKWNPFELDEDDSVVRRKVAEINTPPVEPQVEQKLIPVLAAEVEKKIPTKPDPPPPEPSHVGNAAPPTGLLIHRAVAEFDEELRSMAEKSASPEESVVRAMKELFPNDDDLELSAESSLDKAAIARESHRKDVARHLLSAGFHIEQIREAIKRTSSVEAAVEWILETNWSGQ